MPLIPQKLALRLNDFINQKQNEQIDDESKVKQNQMEYCQLIEDLIYEAIRDMTIIIPSGGVIVAGSPTTQTNPSPIVTFQIT